MSGGNKKKAHATMSFEQMVSTAMMKRMEPYIQQQVQLQGHIVTQKVSRLVLDPIAQLQTRLMALEHVLAKRLGLEATALVDEIANKIAEMEDDALGMFAVETAQAGDCIRCAVESKAADAAEYSNRTKIRIERLLQKVQDRVQTFEPLEQGLEGLKVGDVKEITLPAEGKDDKEVSIRITVERISRRKEEPKPAEAAAPAPAEEAPQGEANV